MRNSRLQVLLSFVVLLGLMSFSPPSDFDVQYSKSVNWSARGSDEQTVLSIGPADRQAELRIPGDIGENETLPLVVALHGFSQYPFYVDGYFQGANSVDANRHLLLTPDGTENQDGYFFWNGTPACCDFYGQKVDDVGYLSGLIDTAVSEHGADPDRVMLIGHSNGGFMSHRMACDAGNKLHTIINFAGATFGEFSDCSMTGYPNIVNVHGTSDGTIDYNGGDNFGNSYASSPDGAAWWAERSGCDASSTPMGTLDLVDGDGVNETARLQHLNCAQGNRVAHWILDDIGHTPAFTDGSLINTAFDWAFNQPVEIEGCTDAEATNFDEDATLDDGSCEYPPPPPVEGCMDPAATNFDETAEIDDGSCEYPPPPIEGCMDSNATNYDATAAVDDGSCEYRPLPIEGCTNSSATNYDATADVDDGSCEYPPPPIEGCMNSSATNYDESATVDDGSCEEPPPAQTEGCLDPTATNYDETAAVDDGSCQFVEEISDDGAQGDDSGADASASGEEGLAGSITPLNLVLGSSFVVLTAIFLFRRLK